MAKLDSLLFCSLQQCNSLSTVAGLFKMSASATAFVVIGKAAPVAAVPLLLLLLLLLSPDFFCLRRLPLAATVADSLPLLRRTRQQRVNIDSITLVVPWSFETRRNVSARARDPEACRARMRTVLCLTDGFRLLHFKRDHVRNGEREREQNRREEKIPTD